jgi:hypothetical protein
VQDVAACRDQFDVDHSESLTNLPRAASLL